VGFMKARPFCADDLAREGGPHCCHGMRPALFCESQGKGGAVAPHTSPCSPAGKGCALSGFSEFQNKKTNGGSIVLFDGRCPVSGLETFPASLPMDPWPRVGEKPAHSDDGGCGVITVGVGTVTCGKVGGHLARFAALGSSSGPSKKRKSCGSKF
jgi:hypothetical protein